MAEKVVMKMKGLLRGQPEFQEIAKQVFPKGTQMAADASKLRRNIVGSSGASRLMLANSSKIAAVSVIFFEVKI